MICKPKLKTILVGSFFAAVYLVHTLGAFRCELIELKQIELNRFRLRPKFPCEAEQKKMLTQHF